MEKIDILMWMIGGGFAITFGLFKIMWTKIEKLDEKITDIDRRLCRLEGAFTSKECCILSNRETKRAE